MTQIVASKTKNVQYGLTISHLKPFAPPAFEVIFSSMDWQQLVSLTTVAAAAGLLLAGKFRRRRFQFQRDTHCGCGSVAQSAPQTSIIFRARKGQRPEVLVKMR